MDLLDLIVAGLLAAWLVAIAVIDLRTFRIPDGLSVPLVAAGLVLAAWQVPQMMLGHLLGAVIGFASLALVGEAFYRWRSQEGLGLGDAKLFAASGAWLGWQALPFVLLVAALSGLVQAFLSKGGLRPGRRLAFGPHLSASFWTLWLLAAAGLSPVPT